MAIQPGVSPVLIERPKVILVEGRDDRRFLEALLQHLDLAAEFQVILAEGVSNLRAVLKAAVEGASGSHQVEALGLIRDADSDPHAAFQSLENSLQKVGLSVPPRPGEVVAGNPTVGVFIWPDCHSPGQLETLCLKAVSTEPALQCVDMYVKCLEREQETLPQPIEKARLHAFLASRNKPGLRLGEAAAKGYWPWSSPVFDPLKQFLRAL